jgi:hypothetical protein
MNPPAQSAWHERRRGREAAGGESHVLAALVEGLGRRPEGSHELSVNRVEHLASGFRRPHGPAGLE